FKTRENAKRAIFEYIEALYNLTRQHAKIGNQAPADFAKQFYTRSQILFLNQ
ncbi:MAG: IS3 family transposase, partial [Nitrosomonas sp.]